MSSSLRIAKSAAAERGRAVPRWLPRAVLIIAAGLAAIIAGIGLWLMAMLPPNDATVRIGGISGPVGVLRDQYSVPHIFASSDADAAFGLGHVHAEDRLWQMESQRRLAAGRLAEVIGPRALPSDRAMRLLGFAQLVERQYAAASPQVKATLDAYADGVNAWIDRHQWTLPIEFALLRYRPERWRPVDALLATRLLAARLSLNRGTELLRARLATRLTAEQLADLWPGPDKSTPITFADSLAALRALSLDRDMLDRLAAADPLTLDATPGGSNIWILDGAKTTSGRPLLANDPHLGFSAPIIWYLAGIETPALSLSGATIPGVPFLIIGHNQRIAWGLTSTHGDVEDLFIERIDPADPTRYLTPSGSQPFEAREETIAVRGQPAERLIMRRTRHGPVISDLATDARAVVEGALAGRRSVTQGDHVLTLAATYLSDDDRTAEGAFRINRATNWPEFLTAAALFDAPQQNIGYADTAGNIGLIAAGRMPVRRPGSGLLPQPGWTGESDWRGFVPFEDHPRSFNPASGRLFNANNRLVGPGYPWDLGDDWDPGFRAARIGAALVTGGSRDMPAASRLQRDDTSLVAERLLPLLLERLPVNGPHATITAMLRVWIEPGAVPRMAATRAEPLIFAAWMRALGPAIYDDELGDNLPQYWGYRSEFVQRVLTERQSWCDDVTTSPTETCDDRVALALNRAVEDLSLRFGADVRGWRWGEAHRAQFNNTFLQALPLLAPLVNLTPPLDGSNDTVLQAASRFADPWQPFAAVHGPGLRMITDLEDVARSRYIIATGESGNPLSPHYRDLLPMWLAGDSIEIARSREVLRRIAIARIRFYPARSGSISAE